ncbi:hypothetical protein BDZ94DRAFT_1317514 [Collybia nuda]|uniref:F-box domain-containing protein n=1 Tax=Collybia nuda TaxID=64659 RepID=A0A9P6CJX4_9AGAR|nr:hypothetical protein BDZ94DRAFT_1317514 [Collybia nuda]
MFLHLPVELLHAIFQQTSTHDLLALSTTHSLFYSIAQPLLYRHISIPYPPRNAAVVIALAQKPQLAHHVRSFAIRLDSSSTFFNPFYQLLAKALSAMTELTSLDLFVDPAASWVLQGTHTNSFPRLRHFGCSFPLDANVAAFLSITEAVVELELDAISTNLHSTSPLPVGSLPQLSQFVGSVQAAQAVVPGRPVESIHLSSGDLTESDVVTLARSTAHVVILGATTSSLPVPLLEKLTHCMPHLVYLRMMTTYNFSEAPDVAFYQNIASALASLSDLKAFELSGMHWGSSPKDVSDKGRVWQSQPLTNHFGTVPLDVDFGSDLFFAY